MERLDDIAQQAALTCSHARAPQVRLAQFMEGLRRNSRLNESDLEEIEQRARELLTSTGLEREAA